LLTFEIILSLLYNDFIDFCIFYHQADSEKTNPERIFQMKPLYSFFQKNLWQKLMGAGLFLSALSLSPYFILGQNSIVTYHDQLDGELLSYILSARYLFSSTHIYPEIMNGLPSTGAVAPAPAFVLLYVVASPFTAFLLSQLILCLVAFSGMYLLLGKLSGRQYPFLSFLIAMIFMLMPFYPVYGLCIPGMPLLCLAFLRLSGLYGDDTLSRRVQLSSYTMILLYGFCSSLVLVGFACLAAAFLFLIFLLLNKAAVFSGKSRRSALCHTAIGILVLLLSYLMTNFSLLTQVFFPSTGYISHKTEYVISPQNFMDSLKQAAGNGITYAQSFSPVILLITVLILLCCLILFLLHRSFPEKTSGILTMISIILIISLLYAFYHGTSVTALRNSQGGIWKEFNLDRIGWLLPVCWCILALYCCIWIVSSHVRIPDLLKRSCVFVILCIWGLCVFLHSSVKPNISRMVKGNSYYALDWSKFFAQDIFTQIDTAIGKPKDSYRVVSIGIYPAAAAYNGFYCLDGYSNNYPLTYKHEFRKIFSGELDKNNYIKALFDNWGNRCYISTAEQSNYYTFEKKWNSVIYHLNLNIPQLQKMNCRYVFSAAYLMNASDMGLTLLRDKPFETDTSWYHIYVYVVPDHS